MNGGSDRYGARRVRSHIARVGWVALALVCILTVGPRPVAACMIDGKPSAFANGVEATIALGMPTHATYKSWAHFIFPRSFKAGAAIRFSEDKAQIHKILPASAQRRPWRWDFGDGGTGRGPAAAHTYRRAARYKISVDAYYPGRGWLAFDSITIVVR